MPSCCDVLLDVEDKIGEARNLVECAFMATSALTQEHKAALAVRWRGFLALDED